MQLSVCTSLAVIVPTSNLLSPVRLLRLLHRALTGRFTAAPEIAPVRRLWHHARERTDGGMQNARLRRADWRLSLSHHSRSIDHEAAKGVVASNFNKLLDVTRAGNVARSRWRVTLANERASERGTPCRKVPFDSTQFWATIGIRYSLRLVFRFNCSPMLEAHN